MQRILIAIFFLIFLKINSTAQLVSVTPKGGGAYTNVNTISQPEYNDYENQGKVGGAGGVQFDFVIGGNDLLRFSPELFFVQNGTKEDFSYYNSTTMLVEAIANRRVNLDYIGIHLPFEMEAIDEMGNGGFFTVSLFSDFAINGRTLDESGESNPVEFSSDFDKIDFGVSAAMGFAQNGISIQLGYNYGLKNIEFADSVSATNINPNPNDGGIYQINNKGFTLQIGYIIPTN